jgi:hypothetical protein
MTIRSQLSVEARRNRKDGGLTSDGDEYPQIVKAGT